MMPVLIYEETLQCPICKRDTLKHSEYVYDSGPGGVLNITVFSCSNCGFNEKFVKPFEESKPIEIRFEVKSEDDLNVLVYRSPTAQLEIPELGISTEPGELYQGIITTVEGLLEDIIDTIGDFCDEECIKKLQDAKEGKIKFTIVLQDPSGLSFVRSEKAIVTQL